MTLRLPSRQDVNRRIKDFMVDESGAIALIMAAALVALLGIGALAVDIGYMSSVQDELKIAAEAGALAGAAALGNNTDWSAAANTILQKNGQSLADCQVKQGYWSLVQQKFLTTAPSENPSPVDAIKVVVAKNVQMSFAAILPGINSSQNVTGTAVAVPRGGSPYTLFVGDPVNYPSSDLNLNAWFTKVTGSVFSNDNVSISGWFDNITGAAVAHGKVTKSGLGISVGSTTNNAATLPMPDYSKNIIDIVPTANKYSGNQTFSGNNMSIANSIYVQKKAASGKGRHSTPAEPGDVTINGIGISTTGAILADGDITVTSAGFTMSGANQMALYSINGDITINAAIFSDVSSSAIIYAPNGKVTVNALGAAFQGSIIAAKGISIGGAFMTFKGGYGIKSIPGASGAFGGGGQGAALVQ